MLGRHLLVVGKSRLVGISLLLDQLLRNIRLLFRWIVSMVEIGWKIRILVLAMVTQTWQPKENVKCPSRCSIKLIC
jgi:hypothetical protein